MPDKLFPYIQARGAVPLRLGSELKVMLLCSASSPPLSRRFRWPKITGTDPQGLKQRNAYLLSTIDIIQPGVRPVVSPYLPRGEVHGG